MRSHFRVRVGPGGLGGLPLEEVRSLNKGFLETEETHLPPCTGSASLASNIVQSCSKALPWDRLFDAEPGSWLFIMMYGWEKLAMEFQTVHAESQVPYPCSACGTCAEHYLRCSSYVLQATELEYSFPCLMYSLCESGMFPSLLSIRMLSFWL